MKSYRDITNKYLRKNLKRSILIVCGVILSVALITSIGLFIKGFQNMYIEQEIQKRGAYHVKIEGSINDFNKLKNNPKIDRIGIFQDWDMVTVKSDKKIELIKMDKTAFELLPYKAIEGRLPENSSEIALEKWVLRYLPATPKLGDSIELKLSDNTIQKFKITGFVQEKGQHSGESVGLVLSDKFNSSNFTIYLSISKNADISDTVKQLKHSFESIDTNSYLLDYMGEGQDNDLTKKLYLIAAIVIAVAVLATLAVIYNSFQISVVERIKQFGLLKAVGATPKQIRSIVLREASIVSITGIPAGLLSGIFAQWVITKVFQMMSKSIFKGIQLVVPWYVLLISALIGIVTIYASAMIPAMFAARISPLSAISSRTSIVKEKVSKRRGRLVKKIFGISSAMAFKNIKRNRKRFRVTVFSIAVSVCLFIFFSAFINMSSNFNSSDSESSKSHFIVYGMGSDKSTLTQDVINKIRKNIYVKDIYTSYGHYMTKVLLSTDQKDPDFAAIAPDAFNQENVDGQSSMSVKVMYDIYDRDKIEQCGKYVTGGKIDYDKMVSENGVILIKNNQISRGDGKRYKGPVTKLGVSDKLVVNKNTLYEQSHYYNENSQAKITFSNPKELAELKVSAVVDDAPFDFYSEPTYLRIIVPKDVFDKVSNSDIFYTSADIILKDSNIDGEFEKWLQDIADSSNIRLSNIIAANKQNNANNLQMKILMYGFIVVISLIGAVNIVNTVTTNLLLRRKEIASLSALGMTYKNVRGMILTEGVLYGLYGCLYGTFGGTVLCYISSMPMRDIMNFKWGLPLESIGLCAAAAIAISLVSVVKPLKRIKHENIIDVIRMEE